MPATGRDNVSAGRRRPRLAAADTADCQLTGPSAFSRMHDRAAAGRGHDDAADETPRRREPPDVRHTAAYAYAAFARTDAAASD